MPNPTDAQIDQTQLVLELSSFDQTRELILGLNDAQWAAQLEANAAWKSASSGKRQVVKVGAIEFQPGATSVADVKRAITDDSRRRFGLPELSGVGAFPTTLNWMNCNGRY